jgi:hypothetical protein
MGLPTSPLKPWTAKSGAPYWFRACTLIQRARLFDAAGVKAKEMENPSAETLAKVGAYAAIALVVDENGSPMFEASDLEGLLNAQLGSEVEELCNAVGGQLRGPDAGEVSEGASAAASLTSSPES